MRAQAVVWIEASVRDGREAMRPSRIQVQQKWTDKRSGCGVFLRFRIALPRGLRRETAKRECLVNPSVETPGIEKGPRGGMPKPSGGVGR